MPSDCSHSGIGVIVQVVRPGPDIGVDERPEGDDREPVAPDRLLGLLREEVVEHPEEAAGQQEADGIVAVPPLHDGILGAREQRIGFPDRHRQRQAVDDVQHRHDDDQRAVEPVGNVDGLDLALRDRAEEDDREADPGRGDREVERPFELRILLAGVPAREYRDRAEHDRGLPGIEDGPGQPGREQPDVRGALHAVERGRDQRRYAEPEQHERRMRGAQAAERQGGQAPVDRRPDQLGRDVDAGEHAEQCPEHGAVHECGDDAVFVGVHVRSRSAARCRCPTARP